MDEWRLTPTRLGPERFGGIPVVMASCGDDHTIALAGDGRVWVWGSGREAQQGGDDRASTLVPACIPVERFSCCQVVAVAAGDDHSLAITGFGDIYTWGRGALGRLGHGDQEDRLTPSLLERTAFRYHPVVHVACGKFHSSAITLDGSVWLFGWNEWGQLGVGDRVNRFVPERLNPENVFQDSRALVASCGAFHTLTLTEDGSVYSWGRGTGAQLGHGDLLDRLKPARITADAFKQSRIVMVAASMHYSAAVGEDGQLFTWGSAALTDVAQTPVGLCHGECAKCPRLIRWLS